MSALDDIVINHFRESDRSTETLPLVEMEAFVRAIAELDGDQDGAWAAFQQAAQFWIAEEGTAFLPSVITEGHVSSYHVAANLDETRNSGGEGLIRIQRILRRLKIPRLNDFETRRFGEALDEFCMRLSKHGYACYSIGTDSPEILMLVVKNAGEFERVASAAGIEVSTSWR